MRVVALIPAAGQGTRLGAQVPKAYVELAGSTLLERSVATMNQVADEVIVLVSPDMEAKAAEILSRAQMPARLVHGGGERAESVWAGLQAIVADDDDDVVVLVHDAARALTPVDMVRRVVDAVRAGAEGVIPVLPVADTIKRVRKPDQTDAVEEVIDTPDRSQLRAVQTPQGFRLERLRAANAEYFNSPSRDFVATDDASLLEHSDGTVVCVDGDPLAMKITTPMDLALAKALLAGAEK